MKPLFITLVTSLLVSCGSSSSSNPVPEIYVNSLNEYFNLDTSSWPIYSIQDDSQGYMFDIVQSGTHDLIMYPLKANISAEAEIYLTNKNLTD